jgi:hypothetical protein
VEFAAISNENKLARDRRTLSFGFFIAPFLTGNFLFSTILAHTNPARRIREFEIKEAAMRRNTAEIFSKCTVYLLGF